MKKENIKIFGEKSIAICEKCGLFTYQIRRLCDNTILAKGLFRKYKGEFVRTMYTGEKFASGDYILVADMVNGSEKIYTFK